MDWTLRNDLPIYSQLMQQMSEAIYAGKLPPGSKIPSVRDIALEAGVNPNTVQRALTDLEREGLVYSQRTSGRFVTEDILLLEHKKLQMAKGKVQDFMKSMKQLGCDMEEILQLLKTMEEEQL